MTGDMVNFISFQEENLKTKSDTELWPSSLYFEWSRPDWDSDTYTWPISLKV